MQKCKRGKSERNATPTRRSHRRHQGRGLTMLGSSPFELMAKPRERATDQLRRSCDGAPRNPTFHNRNPMSVPAV